MTAVVWCVLEPAIVANMGYIEWSGDRDIQKMTSWFAFPQTVIHLIAYCIYCVYSLLLLLFFLYAAYSISYIHFVRGDYTRQYLLWWGNLWFSRSLSHFLFHAMCARCWSSQDGLVPAVHICTKWIYTCHGQVFLVCTSVCLLWCLQLILTILARFLFCCAVFVLVVVVVAVVIAVLLMWFSWILSAVLSFPLSPPLYYRCIHRAPIHVRSIRRRSSLIRSHVSTLLLLLLLKLDCLMHSLVLAIFV